MTNRPESPEVSGKKLIIYGAVAILLFTLLMGAGTFACGKLWPKPAKSRSVDTPSNDATQKS